MGITIVRPSLVPHPSKRAARPVDGLALFRLPAGTGLICRGYSGTCFKHHRDGVNVRHADPFCICYDPVVLRRKARPYVLLAAVVRRACACVWLAGFTGTSESEILNPLIFAER